ncbi:CaiB/BaiF CoA transferase family protein [Trujillonella humicola]|uniref:CaiB/BaiF CoA transferase family protein n=1 Tax=Trujillonella humicola TaxID=3383699 RepID=UPI003906093D
MTGPLAGLTVVSLEQAVAAPFATRQLADLGARVVKVERPGAGDFARGYDEAVHGQSSYFVWLNRSKESVTLDLKSPAGRAVLEELLGGADVFVQNLAPGATARLGLSAAELQARHPRLVVCDVSGYGADGPWAERKAYDLLVQAESGLMSLTGPPGEAVKVGISVADIAAGMYAYSGILTALLQRAGGGPAPAVQVSLFEALAEWMGSPAYYTEYGGRSPARVGAEHATIAPYGPYRTASGDDVVVAVQNDREWLRFCSVVLADPDLAVDPRFARNSARVAHRCELNAIVGERLARLDTPAVVASLDDAGVAHAGLRSVREFLDHPVLAGRDRWRTVQTPGGPVRALRPPADVAGAVPRMDPVPAVGEHTDAVLRSLGRTDDDIARLRADGVI